MTFQWKESHRPEQIVTLRVLQCCCAEMRNVRIRHVPTAELQIETPELSIGPLQF